MFDEEKALAQLKLLLPPRGPEEEPISDDLLKFLMEDCVLRVIGYCRRDELPEELYTLIPVMAARAYEVNGYGGQGSTVASWTQGDRSESYEDSSVVRDDWINDFVSRMEPFRRRRGRLPSEIQP